MGGSLGGWGVVLELMKSQQKAPEQWFSALLHIRFTQGMFLNSSCSDCCTQNQLNQNFWGGAKVVFFKNLNVYSRGDKTS